MNRPVTTTCACNVLARQRGLDPVGSAGSFADAIVVETPLPWQQDIYERAGKLPQQPLICCNYGLSVITRVCPTIIWC